MTIASKTQEHSNLTLSAKRCKASGGREVEMATFKMIDKSTGEVLVPTIENGYLMSEWLTIARTRDRDSYNAVIEGMSGYNAAAFCKSLSRNINKLKGFVWSDDRYQVIT